MSDTTKVYADRKGDESNMSALEKTEMLDRVTRIINNESNGIIFISEAKGGGVANNSGYCHDMSPWRGLLDFAEGMGMPEIKVLLEKIVDKA